MIESMKVFVALSGGVDSAVAALLLKQQGHEVVGAFMKNWSGDDGADPCWIEDRRDALRVAAHLGIPCITLDFEEAYRREVLEYLYREYDAGRTPNPDVLCNATIKFPLFWQEVSKLGADAIATGHYARIHSGRLLTGIDTRKDQSYYLHRLTSDDLSHTLFPVGDMTKSQVRKLARAAGIPVADKRSTRGICFVGRVDLPEFVKSKTVVRPGRLVRADGSFVAFHQNITPLTIGQRQGVSLGGAESLYVALKDQQTATVVVAPEGDPLLARREFDIIDAHWIGEAPDPSRTYSVRIRSLQTPAPCRVRFHGSTHETVVMEQPQTGVAPGQFAVFYDGDVCLGGGMIT